MLEEIHGQVRTFSAAAAVETIVYCFRPKKIVANQFYHMNTGGTGGSDTAGLGGRGGPYRLDSGHPIHQISDEVKAQVSKESQEKARKIARESLEKKLKELDMGESDSPWFRSFSSSIIFIPSTRLTFCHDTKASWIGKDIPISENTLMSRFLSSKVI